ncbi:isoprenylcysteine carboxylmethyltransferase family protein [Dysgonomonas sp. Marseille-P4677]|uniref:methyltransferase family protein n=1 Tax=Dysgonomonas sp. Marseille-P4677 TaxID=2364790 RepID=UPI001914C394|nr:isoprenylcysteine carboxylmethyltransferase family protein [Dysgonomonas sp. Marseille-P4677]MBK5722976.1 isoprenylcysteine carboxylmethyltransferase family protein [Dysgonomonas sp. Marseille-P4677]
MSLVFKSIAGILILITVIGLVLFLPGMSFNYPLAWIYIAMFFISQSIITIYLFLHDKKLLKSRLSVGPTTETRGIQKIIQAIAILMSFFTLLLSAFDYNKGWSEVPPWLSYASAIVIALAFVEVFFVYKQNTWLSTSVKVQYGHKVISTGLYGIVRHPMYLGVTVLMLATPSSLGSWWGMIPAIIFIITFAARAIDEENELRENLPGYTDYCKKVRYRIIPFVF